MEKRSRIELRVTHWVSSRGKGDGLHVMIGDYLWRKTVGQNVGDMKYVGSETKACGWRDKCAIITEKSAFSLH